MRVIVCGAGQVGYGIAERLAAEDNNVTVIDSSPGLVNAIKDTIDVRGIVGHAAHPDILKLAGCDEADMIVAVTLHDEVNMVACQVAHSLFAVPTKVARVRAQSYLQDRWKDLFSTDHMPIDVIISPEVAVGDTILRRLALPGATETVPFLDGKAAFLGIVCGEDCPVVDTPLRQLTELFPDLSATVVGISRNDKLFVPHATDQMAVGDLAYVITSSDRIQRTLTIFGHEEKAANRIVIAGGGNIGFYVAEKLEERRTRTNVRIIEPSHERAVSIADRLSRAVVLHGSAMSEAILREADIRDADTLVAVTNDDRVNILACVIAKQLGCQRTLCLLNDATYPALVQTIGIDSFVNPRAVTISRILEHVRRGRIRSVYAVEDGAAEVIEAEALKTSPLVGRPLRELDLPDGIRIGALYRDGTVITPSGGSVIETADRIVFFATIDQVKRVEQLARVTLEYF